MRIPLFGFRLGPRALAAIVAALSIATGLALSSAPSSAAGDAIQFDEVTKFVGGNANPQPGSFSTDFQAAVSAQQEATAAQNAPPSHGLFGGLKNMMNMAKSVGNTFKSGFASREYYLGNLHRTDNPGAQTATIYRPDQHRTIELDLAKKTYTIIEENNMAAPGQVSQAPSQPGGSPQPVQPGTGNLSVAVSSSSLGSKTIEGVATNGYSFHFKTTMTNATGSCQNGSFETSSIEWLSAYPEPGTTSQVHVSGRPARPSAPELASFQIGCRPKITRHISSGGQAPTGKLSMFSIIGIGGSVQTQGGPAGGSFQTLIERGNVRALTSADRNLFEIPAGFTQAVPSPTPAP